MTLLTVAPLSSRLFQRFPQAVELTACASESTVVHAAEDQPMRPAFFPAGELERITGVHEFSAGLEDEVNLATRDEVHHTATIAWRLKNIFLAAGRLCNYRSYKRLTFRTLPLMPMRTELVDETVAFCSSDAGNDYFAHFLLDDATTALLGEEFGRVVFGGNMKPRTSQMIDYMDFFDVSFSEASAAKFRDVWIFTDHPQNAHRRERLKTLCRRVRAKFADKQQPAPAYIRRGESGMSRKLENETEIEALLISRGFRIIDPESMTTSEICSQLNNSPLIVGVEGSQLAHGLLSLRPGGGMLCIQPAGRFNAMLRSFCNSLDMEWGFVVAEGSDTQFRVCEKRLLQTIDAILERGGTAC